MKKLWTVYSKNFPAFIVDFLNVKELKRLENIGMNCGCEYTSFEKFKNCKKYSRFTHSVGVALIIWKFTKDIKQSIAGLFHDISTPVFAHTIDFLNRDFEKQESTEENTKEIIESSKEIRNLLKKYNLNVVDVCNYHIYEIADNKSPKLSADRLEYSLGNMLNYGFSTFEDVKSFYDDLIVSKNEFLENEIVFKNKEKAYEFSKMIIKNSYLYVSDEDRASMQFLSEIIKFSIEKSILKKDDLYKDEVYVIEKLKNNKETLKLWEEYRSFSKVFRENKKEMLDNAMKVSSKRRYIDAYVENLGRVSSLYEDIFLEFEKIKNLKFDYWISLK